MIDAGTVISIAVALFVALVSYIYLRDQRRLDALEKTVTKDRHYMKSFEQWVRLTFERWRPGSMKDFPKRPTEDEDK